MSPLVRAWCFHGADELVETEIGGVRVHDPATEPGSSLVFVAEENGDPGLGMRLQLVEAACRIAVPEVAGPTGQEPVESPDDHVHGGSDQKSGGEFAHPLPGSGHGPCRRPPGQEPQLASWGFDPAVMEPQEIDPCRAAVQPIAWMGRCRCAAGTQTPALRQPFG